MQKTGAFSLSACIDPRVMTKSGSAASRQITPFVETAQRSRAMLSDSPAKRGDSGADHRRTPYSAVKTSATPTTAIVSRSVSQVGRPSVDDIAIARSPTPTTSRWMLRQRRLAWLVSE